MRVLISGAGVAGPTLAYWLKTIGASVTVVEKAPNFRATGQNIDIQGSAITVVRKMGLLDEIRRRGTGEVGSQLIDDKGRAFAPFPQDGGRPSPTNPYEILRGDLAETLFEPTKNHPNVKYLFDTTIKNVISNDEKAVKVELSNGEVQTYDLLAVCDGQWSRVRKQCFAPESVKVVDKGMYVVYWTIPRTPTDNNWWNIYFGKNCKNVTLRPDPHGTIRAMFTYMPSTDAQKQEWQTAARGGAKAQKELVRREFMDAGWEARRIIDAMDQAPDFYFYPIQQIKMDKWSNGRVICLGDTAYAPTPITGSGTPLAILGAYCLAGELSTLKEGEHPRRALEAYENVYHPWVNQKQDVPSFIPSVGHPGTWWKRWLLTTALSTMSRIIAIPWVARKLTTTEADWEADNDGFPLPDYPTLDAKISSEKV